MRRKCADCDRSTAALLGRRAAKVAPIHVSAAHPEIALISLPATALKAHLSAVFSAGSGRAVCLANFPRLALVIAAATLIRHYFDPIDFRRDVRTAAPPPQSPLRLTLQQYGHSSYCPITGRLWTPVPARPLPLRAPARRHQCARVRDNCSQKVTLVLVALYFALSTVGRHGRSGGDISHSFLR